jgi:succinate dehydrogenase/fumarate reductase flavoprotein subunit
MRPDQSCDVLVIGSGGAGLRAAIAAWESAPDLDIVVLTKGQLGRTGTTANSYSDRMAFHATLADTDPGGPDNWRHHADDIYRIGGGVSDADLAEILARRSAEAFDYLDRLGVPFARRPDGRPDQFITDGSEFARACYTGPDTAHQIEQALLARLAQTSVRAIEHHLAAELLLGDGRAAGVLAVDERTGEETIIDARAAVLATGGAGEAFEVHVYPPGMTGDGCALAYRAGAELVNMEFIQIGLSSVATKLACSGSMMRAVPRFAADGGFIALDADLVFAKGATWPVSAEAPTRAIDVAVFRERAAGRAVSLDFSANPSGFEFDRLEPRWRERYQSEIKQPGSERERARSPLARLREINPMAIAWLRERGIDVEAGDRIEIAPAAQHFQGGVKIRTQAETTVAGLFAAGECAGGQHGANRPGGNALLDTQVFGRIAGESAAAWARANPPAQAAAGQRSPLDALLSSGGLAATEARAAIQRAMGRAASVVRTPAGLQAAIEELGALRSRGIAADDAGAAFAVETRNLLDVAEMVLRAAALRRESRGPHLLFARADDAEPLPRDDADWRRYIVIRRGDDGAMKLEPREPVRPTR